MIKPFVVFYFCSLSITLFANPHEIIIWSDDKTALAFCDLKGKSACYVVCKNKFADVSAVEKGNIGKLGRNNKYEKVVTYPISWESDDEFGCMFWFRTHAWLNGQRYTAKEPVYVTDGRFIQR